MCLAEIDIPNHLLGFSRGSEFFKAQAGRCSSSCEDARIAAPMNCPHCRRPLIKIDYYGDLLVGCIECNRWGRPGDKTLVMELLEDDLERYAKHALG